MSWQQPKVNWDTHPKAIEAADLNRMERNIEVVREQGDIPLNLEVVTSFPAHVAGRAIYHTGEQHAYVSDGSKWMPFAATMIGNATEGQVLSGRTFYSDDPTVKKTGTMPNRGAHNITPGKSDIAIPAGYHSGAGKVSSLGGNAAAGDVLTGKSFSSNTAGRAASGSMPNRGAVTITPGTSNKAIAAGYHSGSGKVVGDSNLKAENILEGKSIFGVAGNIKIAIDFTTVYSWSEKTIITGWKPVMVFINHKESGFAGKGYAYIRYISHYDGSVQTAYESTNARVKELLANGFIVEASEYDQNIHYIAVG